MIRGSVVPQSSKREFKCMILNDPIKEFDYLSSHCFQGQFYPVFIILICF